MSEYRALTIPAHAQRALQILEDAGYEAWIVGGWVRDNLRGEDRAHDVDIASSARWEEAARAFRASGVSVKETGTQHGTITAIVDREPIEVTTYRREGAYSDHRHPDAVEFVDDIREDLARRDFTINAMAYHPKRGLLDLFGGVEDIERKCIRSVGDPRVRFSEDALRVLRALRFATKLGYSIESKTQAALTEFAPHLRDVSRERLGIELEQIIETGKMGWALMHAHSVLSAAIPELQAMADFDQHSPYHAYNVLEHTSRVCRSTEAFSSGMASPALRWAALLHDVCKPQTFTLDSQGRGHFYGHPKMGAQRALDILGRLALPTQLATEVSTLIRLHDHSFIATPKSIRRTLMKLEAACPGRAVPLAFELILLKRADASAKADIAISYAYELDKSFIALKNEIERGAIYKIKDLAIDGRDVMEKTGARPGPIVGAILKDVLLSVVNGDIPNEREALLASITIH